MWMPGERRGDATKDACGTCGREVQSEQPAMECDVCERWEHVECMRQPDRIAERLYRALMANPSKALLFCCTICHRKGCIINKAIV